MDKVEMNNEEKLNAYMKSTEDFEKKRGKEIRDVFRDNNENFWEYLAAIEHSILLLQQSNKFLLEKLPNVENRYENDTL